MIATRLCALAFAAATAGALADCGSRPPSAAPGTPYFVRIAEGLTSPTLAEGIRVAWRMFSAPDLVEACRYPRSVARLELAAISLDLRVGQPFALGSLSVVAVNDAHEAMTAIPIAIDAEDTVPPVLRLRSDDADLQRGQVYPLYAGRFRLKVRTLCGTPGAETMIVGRARAQ